MIVSYDKSGDEEDEGTHTWEENCYNSETGEYTDLTWTSKATDNTTSTGTRTFTKSDEKDEE